MQSVAKPMQHGHLWVGRASVPHLRKAARTKMVRSRNLMAFLRAVWPHEGRLNMLRGSACKQCTWAGRRWGWWTWEEAMQRIRRGGQQDVTVAHHRARAKRNSAGGDGETGLSSLKASAFPRRVPAFMRFPICKTSCSSMGSASLASTALQAAWSTARLLSTCADSCR